MPAADGEVASRLASGSRKNSTATVTKQIMIAGESTKETVEPLGVDAGCWITRTDLN